MYQFKKAGAIMGTWYIKKMESEAELVDKYNFLGRIIAKLKRVFGKFYIKETGNKTIVILPVLKSHELNEKTQEKLANKLAKRLYDKSNQNVVLSNELNLATFKNTLYSKNCNILDGRWLFVYFLPNIIEYVSEKQKRDSHVLEVSIMVNDNSERNLKTIIQIAQKVKMLNIITNNINKFRRIEEYLYTNKGIVVRITNNRKKALIKSNLIFNLDFPEEFVNEYVIPKKTIIVNISEKITIFSKRFSGINSNYYKIYLPQKYKTWFEEYNIYRNFEETVLYESMLYKKNSYEAIEKEIKDNESKIQCLVGNNGDIRDEEFLNLAPQS